MSSSGHDGSISSSSSPSPERLSKGKDFLSPPRRSARLQEKLNCQSFSRLQHQNVSTSDYGTLNSSISTTRDTDLVSVLSDDISNLSFDDFRPDNKENHLKVELVKEKDTNDESDNFYILTPFLTRKLRHNGIKFDLPDENVLMQFLKLFSNVDLYYFLNIQFVNYKVDPNYPPLLSIPVKQDVYCYIHTSNRDEWTFHEKVTAANTRITFPIYKEGHYLFLTRLDQPRYRKCIVDKTETCEFSLSFNPPDPEIKVFFPKECVDDKQVVECTMFFDKLDDHYDEYILAAPILTFNKILFLKPVTFKIEIVNYYIFKEQDCDLHVLYKDDERCQWKKIDFQLQNTEGRAYVQFCVNHFSWFKVVWDAVKGFLFPKVWPTKWMKCQATMNEYENEKFGLEVSVFDAMRDFPQPQNYSHVVGRRMRKLVKSGTVSVSLISSLFEADRELGESAELVKNEEFSGQDFCIEFALKFTKKVGRGHFGKVKVSRKTSSKEETTIFSFNLQKEGNENEPKISSDSDTWSSIALESLADSLFINVDENWKLLAKQLGLPKAEIKKLKRSPSPLLSMKDQYKSMGGTAEEFITKLYEVHRQIKFKIGTAVCSPTSKSVSSLSSCTSTEYSSGIGTLQSSLSGNNPSNQIDFEDFDQISQHSQDLSESISTYLALAFTPPRVTSSSSSRSKRTLNPSTAANSRRRTPNATTPETSRCGTPKSTPENSRKRTTNPSTSTNSKKTRRDRSSSPSEVSTSSSVYGQRDSTVLSQEYLWAFSKDLTSNNWKALGRTLRIDESKLSSIEQLHKHLGIRECYYHLLLEWKERCSAKQCTFGKLYSALVKEKMVLAAKQMYSVDI